MGCQLVIVKLNGRFFFENRARASTPMSAVHFYCVLCGTALETSSDSRHDLTKCPCCSRYVPVPRPMSEWQADKAYKGWTWGIVDVPIERFFGPAEKINITIPGRVLKQIDDYAKKHGQSRSGFLMEAAIEVMRRSSGVVFDSLAHVKRRANS